MADALVTQLARALNLSPDSARHTLNHLVAALREQIDATGEAAVPGLGTFHRDGEQLAFTPDDALARAVNHRYAGLRAISAGPRRPPRPAPEEEAAAAEFQPLETFIEPAEPEARDLAEPDDEQADPDLVEASAALASSDAAPSDDAETEQEEVLPLALAQPAAEDEIEEEDEPISEAEPVAEEDSTVDHEPVEVADPVAEEETPSDDDVDESLVDTWAPTVDVTDDEQQLGAIRDDVIDDDDDESVGKPPSSAASDDLDAADAEAEADDVLEADEMLEAEVLEDDGLAETEDPALIIEDDGEIDDGASPSDEDATALLATTPPETGATPEPPPPVVEDGPPVAPAVAATAAIKSADRPPADTPRSGSGRWLGGLAAVLLIALVALLWFLRRDTDGPTIAERQPVPEDTVAAMPPPVDTSAVAVDTATVAPPQPAPPTPSPDPLRSTAGIDRADGGFAWIVGSEFSLAPAERRVAAFREQGFRADVIAEEANGRTRYRVALGQFSSIEEADRFRSDLPAGVPPDTWLLRL